MHINHFLCKFALSESTYFRQNKIRWAFSYLSFIGIWTIPRHMDNKQERLHLCGIISFREHNIIRCGLCFILKCVRQSRASMSLI